MYKFAIVLFMSLISFSSMANDVRRQPWYETVYVADESCRQEQVGYKFPRLAKGYGIVDGAIRGFVPGATQGAQRYETKETRMVCDGIARPQSQQIWWKVIERNGNKIVGRWNECFPEYENFCR